MLGFSLIIFCTARTIMAIEKHHCFTCGGAAGRGRVFSPGGCSGLIAAL